MYNLAAMDTFAELMKVTNDSGLWGADLSWYSLSANCWIYLLGLEHGLRIYAWYCPIVEVLETRTKFLEPSGSCALLFAHQMAIFLVKPKFSK